VPAAEIPGRIINMSSISGKYSAPFVGAYCASKHALEGMSDSLRRELMIFGIDVIVIGGLQASQRMNTLPQLTLFQYELSDTSHRTYVGANHTAKPALDGMLDSLEPCAIIFGIDTTS